MTVEKQLEAIFELTRLTVSSRTSKLEDDLSMALEAIESLDEQLQSYKAKTEEQALEIQRLRSKLKRRRKKAV